MEDQRQHNQQPGPPDAERPEERADQLCRHLARIIRAAAGSPSSDAPDPVIVLGGE